MRAEVLEAGLIGSHEGCGELIVVAPSLLLLAVPASRTTDAWVSHWFSCGYDIIAHTHMHTHACVHMHVHTHTHTRSLTHTHSFLLDCQDQEVQKNAFISRTIHTKLPHF